jgi:uncharacterized protein (TIGR02413 family)
MTLNILFFTITIGKRVMTNAEFNQIEMIKKIEEENRERQAYFPRLF